MPQRHRQASGASGLLAAGHLGHGGQVSLRGASLLALSSLGVDPPSHPAAQLPQLRPTSARPSCSRARRWGHDFVL